MRADSNIVPCSRPGDRDGQLRIPRAIDRDSRDNVSAPWSLQVVSGTNSHGIVSGSGLGLAWNTFLYGTAPPGVAQVSSSLPDARGGVVVDGVWVIASPAEGLSVGEVAVTFLDANGDVVEQQ